MVEPGRDADGAAMDQAPAATEPGAEPAAELRPAETRAAELRAAEPRPAGTDDSRRPRPLFERLGLAFIALVLAALFAAVAVAAWSGGELFMVAMGATGCVMTLWVGALTLFRG